MVSPPDDDAASSESAGDSLALTRFRQAIVAYVASLTVAAVMFFVPSIDAAFLAEDVASLLDYYGAGALVVLPSLTWLLVLVVNLAACAGLYLFSSQARTVYLVLTAFAFFFAMTGGIVMSGPVSGTVALLASLAQGVILGLAYASPLARRFK